MMDSEASDRTGDELATTHGPSGPTRVSSVVVRQNHERCKLCASSSGSQFSSFAVCIIEQHFHLVLTESKRYGCPVTASRKRPRRT